MTEEELQTRVIDNLRALRKKAGLSQEKLADKADISRQMMNDIEGRRRWLTKGTLVKLANALEVDVDIISGRALSIKRILCNKNNIVKEKESEKEN